MVGGYLLSNAVRPLRAGRQLAGDRRPAGVDRIGKGLRTAPAMPLLADATPPELRGLAYGFHRAMDNGGAMAGALLDAACLGVDAAIPDLGDSSIPPFLAFWSPSWSLFGLQDPSCDGPGGHRPAAALAGSIPGAAPLAAGDVGLFTRRGPGDFHHPPWPRAGRRGRRVVLLWAAMSAMKAITAWLAAVCPIASAIGPRPAWPGSPSPSHSPDCPASAAPGWRSRASLRHPPPAWARVPSALINNWRVLRSGTAFGCVQLGHRCRRPPQRAVVRQPLAMGRRRRRLCRRGRNQRVAAAPSRLSWWRPGRAARVTPKSTRATADQLDCTGWRTDHAADEHGKDGHQVEKECGSPGAQALDSHAPEQIGEDGTAQDHDRQAVPA